MNEEELLKKLREAFSGEAGERLASLSSSLLDLEKGADGEERAQALEVAFREAHSLKGAARSVNLMDIESMCQGMESVFADMKRGGISSSGELFDLLHHCVRAVEDFLATPEGERADLMGEASALMSRIEEIKAGRETEEEPAIEKQIAKPQSSQQDRKSQGKPLVSESVRIPTARLDALFLKAEELISLKLVLGQHVTDLKEIVRSIESWTQRWAEIEPEARALNKIARKGDGWDSLSRFLDWNHDFIGSLGKEMRGLTKGTEQEGRTLGLMVDELLDDMKRVTMLPFSTLLDIFPRMIREISRDQGKEVDLIVKGGAVEIDRRILEEMRDPLTHLLRNSVDHGLEAPDKREKQGKPRSGTIEVIISHTEGGKIEIMVSDDGVGIDPARVKEKAASLGIITKQDMEQLDDRDALSLVLQSGVSTSPIITEISGRGLGLAIVREKVEKLGGSLSMDTVLGRGASFRMALPVTIATFRGILVQVSDRLFVAPSADMDRTLKVHQDEIKTVENRATIPLDGKALPLVDLARVFGLDQGKDKLNGAFLTVVVLGAGERRIGFRVDEVLGEREVLVKDLGKQLKHVSNISGATILGSGRVVPILNVNDLLTSPPDVALQASGPNEEKGGEDKSGEGKKSILVAEDSITSRMLIKSILAGAGYLVTTAVDGLEAYTTLKTGEFDLVVSDIEMPGLNGFELTEKIRSDKKYAEIPVVLVTGLETREDREKGIDAGANAYIVKSSFDQSNLLEVVKRMI